MLKAFRQLIAGKARPQANVVLIVMWGIIRVTSISLRLRSVANRSSWLMTGSAWRKMS